MDQFDVFRAKRHRGLYDLAGAVSDVEAEAMIASAKELRTRVMGWLRKSHPDLVPKGT